MSQYVASVKRVRIVGCMLRGWDHSIDLFWLSENFVDPFSCQHNLRRCCCWYPVSKWLGLFQVVIYQVWDFILMIWWFGLVDLLFNYKTMNLLFFSITTTCNSEFFGVKFIGQWKRNKRSWFLLRCQIEIESVYSKIRMLVKDSRQQGTLWALFSTKHQFTQ